MVSADGIGAEGEAAKPADLTPGEYVVIRGLGLMQVIGPCVYKGEAGIKFSSSYTGSGFRTNLATASDLTEVRALMSTAEAERRLALLADTTPVTDTRRAQERSVELARTMERGTDLQKLALLRAAYASTFAPGPRMYDRDIYRLEQAVLPELAHVLGIPLRELVEKLHTIHAERGTFASTAEPRPEEPAFDPPADPWVTEGHEYVGAFMLTGEHLIAGDPRYVTSKHDEPPGDVIKNFAIPAASGRWHCYVELDRTNLVLSFVTFHESARHLFYEGRQIATVVAALLVNSGALAVVDSAIRDDAAFDDARLFGADVGGIIGGRGCKVPSGAGSGTYTTRVLVRDGLALYLDVDFTSE